MVPYTVPGIGNVLHAFLPIEDRLRMDCVSKEIRAFHREHVYPHAKSLNAELVMDDAQNREAGLSYIQKISKYAETILCVPNKYELTLPSLRGIPKVKHLEYAVTMFVDVTTYDITPRTSDQWTAVEDLIHSLAEDDDHPMRDIVIVPGNIVYLRTSPEGDELEAYTLEDQAEATHCAYYRRFGYDPIYIPMCMYRKEFWFHLPKYLAATIAQEQHGKKITYWEDGSAGSIGRLLLDFH